MDSPRSDQTIVSPRSPYAGRAVQRTPYQGNLLGVAGGGVRRGAVRLGAGRHQIIGGRAPVAPADNAPQVNAGRGNPRARRNLNPQFDALANDAQAQAQQPDIHALLRANNPAQQQLRQALRDLFNPRNPNNQ